ncbi:MAG: glucokinase [Verrucomicrobiota bacterium]|jgi:glucokinase
MILAGDIGGTSTRLAMFEAPNGRPLSVVEQTYSSRKYSGLGEIAAAFVAEHRVKVERACFGIAGPVQQGRVVTPNLPWVVDSGPLARELGLRTVRLINDLEANAYGIAALEAGDFVALNAGAQGAAGNCAVISVGTGLGEAGMYWDGQMHHPFACEGGHADFSPRDELESEFLHYLRARFTEFGHVSYERVLSGPGLREVYGFLRDVKGGQEPAWLREAMLRGDPSAAISSAGLEGRCELCVKALDMFVAFYGAEAGNLALKTMAIGGVYVGGGIAPRIIGKLQGPLFMAAFTAKGRMRPLMEAMPVRVIMKETTALLGAARAAIQTA